MIAALQSSGMMCVDMQGSINCSKEHTNIRSKFHHKVGIAFPKL